MFKGKKVALFGGDSADKSELAIVTSALKKDHVDVVQSAVDSAPEGDLAASDQQITIIAQRFKSAGANVVVGVGTGSAAWPEGMQAIQSTYNPRLVATSFNNLAGIIDTKASVDPTYLKGAVTADPVPSEQSEWQAPAMQKCIGIIKKAYPSTVIGSPVGASPRRRPPGSQRSLRAKVWLCSRPSPKPPGNHSPQNHLRRLGMG